MHLNMTILAEELGDACERAVIRSSERAMSLSHVEILEAPDANAPAHVAADEHVAYLVSAEDLPLIDLRRTRAHVLCIGQPAADPAPEDVLDLVVVSRQSKASLLSAVQRVFQKYERWDERLKLVIMRRGSVADLVAESLDVVRSDILIHDRDLRVIAYKGHDGDDDSPLRPLQPDEAFNQGTIDSFLSSAQSNLSDGQDPFQVKGPHFWVSSLGPRSLAMNVFLNDQCIARIVFATADARRQPTERDVGPLVLLCSYVRTLLSFSFSPLLEGHQDQLADLIGRDELAATMRLQGWNHRDDRFLFLAVRADGAHADAFAAKYPLISIFSRVQEMFRESRPLIREGQGVTLVNLTQSHLRDGAVADILTRIGQESHCTFGMGRPFTGVRGLRQAQVEARAALEHASEAGASRVVSVDDVMLELVDACVGERMPPLSFCPQGLLDLVGYDNRHGSEFYPTLRCYVECNCSPTRCAKALFIQRSTLQYRLERIRQILGMDLDDPRDQLRLRLSFRLLDTLPPEEAAAI